MMNNISNSVLLHPYVKDFIYRIGSSLEEIKPHQDGSIVLVLEESFRVHIHAVEHKSIFLRSFILNMPSDKLDQASCINKILELSQKLFFSRKVTLVYDKEVNAFYAQMEIYDLQVSLDLDNYVNDFLFCLRYAEESLQ